MATTATRTRAIDDAVTMLAPLGLVGVDEGELLGDVGEAEGKVEVFW